MTGRSILGWSEVGLERGDTRVLMVWRLRYLVWPSASGGFFSFVGKS